MSATFQQITVIGRLGKDPDHRVSPNGLDVTTFAVATDESFTKRDGTTVEYAEWHEVTTFGEQAKAVARELRKGMLVQVIGRVRTSEWQTRDGQQRKSKQIQPHSIAVVLRWGEQAKPPPNAPTRSTPARA